MNSVIVDLDGTLITGHDWGEDFDSFYEHLLERVPVLWCLDLVELLAKTHKIIFVTARSERCRHMTKLQLNNWLSFPYELYMRSNTDLRPDWEVKKEITENLMHDNKIDFCIDDNLENCAMFKSLGIPCLHVF